MTFPGDSGKILHNELHLQKLFARWIPSALNEHQKKQFFLQRNYSKCWDFVAKIKYAILSQETKRGYLAVVSETNEQFRCGWKKMPIGRQIFGLVSRVAKDLFPPFTLALTAKSPRTFSPRNVHLLPLITLKP